METLLTYWLKANAVLVLFAAAYYALLRGLTFFQLNRAYLPLAVAFAAVYPLLPVPALLPPVAVALPVAAPAGAPGPIAAVAGSSVDWWLLAGAVYLVGAAGLLLRLLVQLLSLQLVRRQSRPAVVLGQAVRVVPGTGGPFSFGRTIYLTESALAATAALPATLRHEQAHVRQGHTLDVLLLQVATALAWANPAAWLLRRLALDNLEYLADQAALHGAALTTREYQYLLLRQQAASPVPAPALAFQLSSLSLKNRVLMLSHPLSAKRQLGRYLLAAPLVVLVALGYAGAYAQTVPAAPKADSLPAAALYYIDGELSTLTAATELNKHPGAISSMSVITNSADVQRLFNSSAPQVILLTTKANATSPAVQAFNRKVFPDYDYAQKPAKVNALVPKALAYITSHYPEARLSGEVVELTEKTTGAVKYRVQLITGKRPSYVYFTPQGDPVGE